MQRYTLSADGCLSPQVQLFPCIAPSPEMTSGWRVSDEDWLVVCVERYWDRDCRYFKFKISISSVWQVQKWNSPNTGLLRHSGALSYAKISMPTWIFVFLVFFISRHKVQLGLMGLLSIWQVFCHKSKYLTKWHFSLMMALDKKLRDHQS